MKDEPIKQCPRCGEQTAKRLISRTNFVLGGGGCGWAASGYAKGNDPSTPT